MLFRISGGATPISKYSFRCRVSLAVKPPSPCSNSPFVGTSRHCWNSKDAMSACTGGMGRVSPAGAAEKYGNGPATYFIQPAPWTGGSPSMCGQGAGAHPDAGEDAGHGAQGPTIEGRGRCKLNHKWNPASPSSSDVSARADGRDGARRAGAASTQKRGRTRQTGKTRREGRDPPGVSTGVRAGGRPGHDGKGAGGRGRGVPGAARAHRN